MRRSVAGAEQGWGESQRPIPLRPRGINVVDAEQTQGSAGVQKQLNQPLRNSHFASVPSGGASFPACEMGMTVRVQEPGCAVC